MPIAMSSSPFMPYGQPRLTIPNPPMVQAQIGAPITANQALGTLSGVGNVQPSSPQVTPVVDPKEYGLNSLVKQMNEIQLNWIKIQDRKDHNNL